MIIIKLTKLGLIDNFKGIISSSHVGTVKSNSKLFYYAMKLAKSTPKTSRMIGNNPKKDIRGGRSVNMATGWLKRGKYFNVDLGEMQVVNGRVKSKVREKKYKIHIFWLELWNALLYSME